MEAKDPDLITKGYLMAPWIDDQPNLAEEKKEKEKEELGSVA